MAERAKERRLIFDVAAPDAWLQRLRSALRSSAAVVIDLGQVEAATPAHLGVLRVAVQEAHAAGVEIWVDAVRATVYKALHLAKLVPPCRRIHHG